MPASVGNMNDRDSSTHIQEKFESWAAGKV